MYLYESNFMWLSLCNLQRYKVIDYLAKANPSTIIHILNFMWLSLWNLQRYKVIDYLAKADPSTIIHMLNLMWLSSDVLEFRKSTTLQSNRLFS